MKKLAWSAIAALLSLGVVSIASADYVILVAKVAGGGPGPGAEGGPCGAYPGETEGTCEPGFPGPGPGPAFPGPGPGPAFPGPGPAASGGCPGGEGYPIEGGPQVKKSKPKFVSVIVELRSPPSKRSAIEFVQGKGLLEVGHKFGGRVPLVAPAMLSQNRSIRVVAALHVESDQTLLPSVRRQYLAKEQDVLKEESTPESILEFADWTLTHGMIDQYVTIMEKLSEWHKDAPEVESFQKVQKALETALPVGEKAMWESRLGNDYKLATSAHYAVFHNQPDGGDSKAQLYLKRLEYTFRTYYHWFARKGIFIPMPNNKLRSVLTFKLDDFERFEKLFDSSERVEDGFFVRRHNLIVISSTRQSEEYEALETAAMDILRNPQFKDRDRLVRNNKKATDLLDQQARCLALMLHTMESQGALATCSHFTSRQLLYATGNLPTNVRIPEWIQFGIGSFFEAASNSPWPALGGPNSMYLPHFKQMRKDNELPKRAAETLKKIITNSYFREAADATEEDREASLKKARATAWALTFYLARRDRPGVTRYFERLSKMPRHLELSDEVLLTEFARAFNAWDESRGQIDERKFDYLANRWYDDLNRTVLESKEVFDTIEKAEKAVAKALEKAPANPNAEGQPGPYPGPGGLGGAGAICGDE